MMAHRNLSHPSTAVPADVRPKYEAITALTDAFCERHLNEEYTEMCQRLTIALARIRPSPTLQGNRHGMWSTSMNPCLTRTLSPILNFGANSDSNLFDMVWRKRVLASCVQSTAARIITCVSVSASFRVPV